jgi:hypothetical protein
MRPVKRRALCTYIGLGNLSHVWKEFIRPHRCSKDGSVTWSWLCALRHRGPARSSLGQHVDASPCGCGGLGRRYVHALSVRVLRACMRAGAWEGSLPSSLTPQHATARVRLDGANRWHPVALTGTSGTLCHPGATLCHSVAPCGTLWHPMAPCATRWHPVRQPRGLRACALRGVPAESVPTLLHRSALGCLYSAHV